MSAHFAILREADLVESTKLGKQVIYRLKMSVLEEALLGFAGLFGLQASPNEVQPIEIEERVSK
jgi:hypothetical protein